MSKKMNRKARAFLVAVVTDSVCRVCRCAPGADWTPNECGPCAVKRVDREDFMSGGPWG